MSRGLQSRKGRWGRQGGARAKARNPRIGGGVISVCLLAFVFVLSVCGIRNLREPEEGTSEHT